jgi:hypothetical protein
MCLTLLAIAPAARAQLTAVSGTVIDPNGIPYAGATIKAQLTSPGSTLTINNQAQCAGGGFGSAPCQMPIQGTAGPIALGANGAFSFNLPDNVQVRPVNTQWIFTVNISPGILPPAGTGPQTCTATITITGASQDISSNLSCPALVQIANPSRVYNTPAAAGIVAIGPITMTTAPAQPAAGTRYVFSPYVTQTVNIIFQDPNAAAPQTVATAIFTVTSNGTLGIVPQVGPPNSTQALLANGAFFAKAGTIVQYSASAPTGGSCTTVPTVQIFPLLELQ